jgi:hypothetical protein
MVVMGHYGQPNFVWEILTDNYIYNSRLLVFFLVLFQIECTVEQINCAVLGSLIQFVILSPADTHTLI